MWSSVLSRLFPSFSLSRRPFSLSRSLFPLTLSFFLSLSLRFSLYLNLTLTPFLSPLSPSLPLFFPPSLSFPGQLSPPPPLSLSTAMPWAGRAPALCPRRTCVVRRRLRAQLGCQLGCPS